MNRFIYNLIIIAIFGTSLAAIARYPEGPHRKGYKHHRKHKPPKSAEQHRALAKLHTEAATCMESGKDAKECTNVFREGRKKMFPKRYKVKMEVQEDSQEDQ